MSLDKSIKYKKEKREEYRGASSFDRSCRNHGTCEYCKTNRTIGFKKLIEKSKESLKSYDEEA
jgi:hypothetical protein